ncbi:MAG TPA: tRNA pseudouridine(55) synthase TruB [Candidatus Sulfopaludibacter sp.]|nr:tRNA pseudouridine(55) synthase TruB [Candidatus Sulfopaludibacter sp.]
MDGVIVVDKPEGWTSHDVVNKVRHLAGSKAGHLGTLDPIATGVLPLVLGKATRLAQFYTRSAKIYEALVRFGWSTTSYDRAGEPTSEKRDAAFTAEELEPYLDKFRGTLMQTPPPVSAKKVDGKRAYELARQSIAVELEPVQVQVYELELLAVDGATARLRAHVSGGTYVRSIAHDLGLALGCGAHLEQLRRTLSGEFEIGMARTIPQLQQLIADERLLDALVPSAALLPGMASVYVDDLTVTLIRNGRNFPASPFRSDPAAKQVKAVTRTGELVAIGEAVLPNLYHPIVVM